jgi:hypothetical protein
MALQRHNRKLHTGAAQHHGHAEQLLLHASILAIALLVALVRLIG